MKTKIKPTGLIAIVVIITLGMAACASMSIASVDWDSLKGPAKVRQYFSVSTTDVTVYATYKDESRKEVTFFSTSHDRDRTGTQTVTVTVLGQGSGTFQTQVMELTAIRVDKAPSKTIYTVGEKADLAGIRVMGSWRDLPDAEIPAYQVTATRFDSSSAGTNRLITVDFKGKTATFPVTVTAAATTPAPATTAPATTTPAATTTTQPSQQQPTQQQPVQQQGQDQRLVGTWKWTREGSNLQFTLNANGTGTSLSLDGKTQRITWTTSGNEITMIFESGTASVQKYSLNTTGDRLTIEGFLYARQ